MTKSIHSASKKTGLPPGTLMYVGKEQSAEVSISELDFNTEYFEEKTLKEISECQSWKDKKNVTWINVEGIHDVDVIESIGAFFDLDKLVLEDILNTHQRAKVEEFENYIYIVLKNLRVDIETDIIEQDQLSIVLGDHWLISFQESGARHFLGFRNRIKNAAGKIRQRKTDFICYRLIDSIVDNYFLVSEYFDAKITSLESLSATSYDKELSKDIYDLKGQISVVKKAIIPIREMISGLIRSDSPLIEDDNHKYFRDVYEHVIQIIDTFDSQCENISDFLNLYMSAISNKMNEVMKVLTIFAAIFIPLTFIAGVYGMNFNYMPELGWKYGYPLTWGIMIIVALLLLNYFRRKKWL